MATFSLNENYYNYDDIFEIIKKIQDAPLVRYKNEDAEAFNIPCSFDIETSSFYDEENRKTAIMYIWQLGINGDVVIGRTWSQFFDTLELLYYFLNLGEKRRLVIYVHNLAYEFQFICKRFNWLKVFAVDSRKVAKAVSQEGFEFRCSYLLSGVSLEKMGDDLIKYPVKKKTGDLDYLKLRHSETPLTKEELGYCVNDVLVVMSYIKEKIEKDGDISKIPMTKTSYIRKLVQNNCLYGNTAHRRDDKGTKYRDLMKALQISNEEYEELKRAFMGGFTHAGAMYSGILTEDVTSFDFTSSYPTVLISEMFPMSRGKTKHIKNKEEFLKYISNYCCVFDIRFYNLKSKFIYESYISSSKCLRLEGAEINNGRVYKADFLSTTITDVDFNIISKVYDFDKIEVSNLIYYKRGYLPTDFIKTIVKLYKDKTELKGVEGKEEDYQLAKANLNSCYGMIGTDIVRDDNVFINGTWKVEKANLTEQISRYNKDKKRTLFYPWAVFVTAYARRNLWSGILECGADYIYSDTDSVKIKNADKHKKYIDNYNKWILNRLYKACDFHGIERSEIEPETIKGVKKPLGVWDYDGHYDKFKTLGAKRYMVESNGKLNITVSGLNKFICVPYLKETYKDPFNAFKDGLTVDKDHTGKNTHTYIDDERNGFVEDYRGVKANYKELSGVHLEGADYSLGLSKDYLQFLYYIGGLV